jgi:hypothetical protein
MVQFLLPFEKNQFWKEKGNKIRTKMAINIWSVSSVVYLVLPWLLILCNRTKEMYNKVYHILYIGLIFYLEICCNI